MYLNPTLFSQEAFCVPGRLLSNQPLKNTAPLIYIYIRVLFLLEIAIRQTQVVDLYESRSGDEQCKTHRQLYYTVIQSENQYDDNNTFYDNI